MKTSGLTSKTKEWSYTCNRMNNWLLDSLESHHVTPCKHNFIGYDVSDYGRVHFRINRLCKIILL